MEKEYCRVCANLRNNRIFGINEKNLNLIFDGISGYRIIACTKGMRCEIPIYYCPVCGERLEYN